jgi:hypothetical protein
VVINIAYQGDNNNELTATQGEPQNGAIRSTAMGQQRRAATRRGMALLP